MALPGHAELSAMPNLGYTFQGPFALGRHGYFVSFSPAICDKAKKANRKQILDWPLNCRVGPDLSSIVSSTNSHVRDWSRLEPSSSLVRSPATTLDIDVSYWPW